MVVALQLRDGHHGCVNVEDKGTLSFTNYEQRLSGILHAAAALFRAIEISVEHIQFSIR